MNRNFNGMGDAGKFSPPIHSTLAQNVIQSLLIIWDGKAMDDAATISRQVPSTCVQNAFLSLLILPSILSPQMYVAIDNPVLVPSVSWLTTTNYLWKTCA